MDNFEINPIRDKKIISFSLWGDNPLYINGALWNAKHIEEFYPKWTCRFYHDDTVPSNVLDDLYNTENTELRLMQRTSDVLGMYWRFHPMFDDDTIERFIVRDTDSKFTVREVKMVNEWIDSDFPFHIVRDCESHATEILGGTWGAIPGCIPDFEKKLALWFTQVQPCSENPRGLFHGSDQIFLGKYVWPIIRNNHLAHVRANMPHLHYTGNEIEVEDPVDGHYIGMVA